MKWLESNVWYVQFNEHSTYRLHIVNDWLRKYRLYFLEWIQKLPNNHAEVVENNLPFILFSDNPSSWWIRILWMYVPLSFRGTNFSDMMLSRFFQLLEKSDKDIWLTWQIKKPLLAAKLAKIGFIPERSDIIARIVWLGDQHIPNVIIEENLRGNLRDISSTWKNIFYRVVSGEKYGNNGGRRVAIQTVYIPPWLKAIDEYIAKNSEYIVGKIRMYPSRVKKILDQEKQKES